MSDINEAEGLRIGKAIEILIEDMENNEKTAELINVLCLKKTGRKKKQKEKVVYFVRAEHVHDKLNIDNTLFEWLFNIAIRHKLNEKNVMKVTEDRESIVYLESSICESICKDHGSTGEEVINCISYTKSPDYYSIKKISAAVIGIGGALALKYGPRMNGVDMIIRNHEAKKSMESFNDA